MCSLASKACSPRLLPSGSQRVLWIKLRLLHLSPAILIAVIFQLVGLFGHIFIVVVVLANIRVVVLILGRTVRDLVNVIVIRHFPLVLQAFTTLSILPLSSAPWLQLLPLLLLRLLLPLWTDQIEAWGSTWSQVPQTWEHNGPQIACARPMRCPTNHTSSPA
jgi:hypothetical protein